MPKNNEDDNTKDIDTALKNIRSFSKKASLKEETSFLTTGHFALDLAIAHGVSPDNTSFDVSKLNLDEIGGFPLGKLVELFGTEGSGKSSIGYRVCGYGQKKGMKCLWIDTEQSFIAKLADINGVDLEALEYADLLDIDNPDHVFSAEEVFDRITDACVAGYKVIVLDSVANLVTQAELDNYLSEGGVGMAHLAALMSKAVKKVVQYASKYGTLVIFINQLREKPGIVFGDNESTPGGRALKFLASVRIRMQRQVSKEGQIRVKDDQGNESLIGGYSYARIAKNRFGKPVDGSVKIPIYYEKYFPDAEEVVFDTARTLKIIKQRLDVFSWGENLKVAGRELFIKELKEKDLVSKLVDEVKAEATVQKFILSPEVVNYDSKPPVVENEAEDDNGSTTKKSKVPRKRASQDTTGGAE